MQLSDPTEAALLCTEAFDRAGYRHAVCGGLALAAYGEPRETLDVDLAIADVTADQARAAVEAAGVRCVVAVQGVEFGGLSVDRVTLLGRDDTSGLNVLDLVRPRSARFAAAALSRTVEAPLLGRTIRVVSAEDFVVMKCLATRDKDLDDAASVLRRTGALLDLGAIDREVETLASELPDVDVRGRWAAVRSRDAN